VKEVNMVQAVGEKPGYRVTQRTTQALGLVLVAVLLTACGSTAVNRAPVEDRSAPRSSSTAPLASSTAAPVAEAATPKVLPGQENAGKPGYYTVKAGDTLIRIGLDQGQNWRDIARWNSLERPYTIEIGQVLRVAPPPGAVASSTVVGKPLPPAGAAPTSSATPSSAPSNTSKEPNTEADDIAFAWPVNGRVIAGFDEVKNKGVDLAGSAGDAVLAAADGRVVYAGAGLRGYGNLVILKHNNTYLTAYAHNQSLSVKEDQNVRKGQKIAEMGNTDADRVKLHFEVRRQGKPVDPLKFLPAR
jgi:lipoprotein NlpD